MSAKPREGISFFPLTVDYEERKYAVGKIPGGFVKRGGRPSEKAILTSRLIDRPMRPLFPEGMRNDVQVIAVPLSMEPDVPADMLAMLAASAALAISDIPWNGPIGLRSRLPRWRRVGRESVARTRYRKRILELIVAGFDGKVMEIELEATEVSEDELMEAMDLAHGAIDKTGRGCKENWCRSSASPRTKLRVVAPDAELVAEISAKIERRDNERHPQSRRTPARKAPHTSSRTT